MAKKKLHKKKAKAIQKRFHHPLHTGILGLLLILLHGVLAVFAVIGTLLVLFSAFTYLWRSAKHMK